MRMYNGLAALILAAIFAETALAEMVIPRPPTTLSPDLTKPRLVHINPAQANRLLSIQVPVTNSVMQVAYPPLDPIYLPQTVAYHGSEQAGTIIIDTTARFLYLILEGERAIRYGVGVGRPGFEWSGIHTVTRKAEWPDWYPPEEMRQRVPGLPDHMPGGLANPLGARALYLSSTLYRIHGSNEPWTIGQAVSSGCIRMRNQDVIDLYDRVPVGTRVIVI